MKKILGVTLGIMTALGGFVDLGQIVFTTHPGRMSALGWGKEEGAGARMLGPDAWDRSR